MKIPHGVKMFLHFVVWVGIFSFCAIVWYFILGLVL